MKRIIGSLCMLLVFGVTAHGEQTVVRGQGGALSRQAAGSEVATPGGRRSGPPPEAFAACEGKSEGSTAQFSKPDGETVSGTCRVADGRLVLRPDHPKGNGGDERRGPPPEAFAACIGKSAGSSAQFVDPRGETVVGTCEEEDGRMVLRPANRRGGRPGGGAGRGEK